jgi:hypothetical protein
MKIRVVVLALCIVAFAFVALPGAGAMPFFMGGFGSWGASPALAASAADATNKRLSSGRVSLDADSVGLSFELDY